MAPAIARSAGDSKVDAARNKGQPENSTLAKANLTERRLSVMLADDQRCQLSGRWTPRRHAATVPLDATVVRMIHPAVMTLLDDRGWWFLAGLERVVPNIDIEGEELAPRTRLRAVGEDGEGLGDDHVSARA